MPKEVEAETLYNCLEERGKTVISGADKLYREMRFFKIWAAKKYPERDEKNDNGEWEIDNIHFDKMYDAAVKVISENNSNAANAKLIDALLYAVARDNEAERLADLLVEHGDWFRLLSRESLGSKYINAQWQFAKRLAECKESDKDLIYVFIESDDEYTSRMSLGSMAGIDPVKAEEYAVRFWERGKYEPGTYEDEYQKIMVLHVLYKIASPKLEKYLNEALRSDYKWLRENAETIRSYSS